VHGTNAHASESKNAVELGLHRQASSRYRLSHSPEFLAAEPGSLSFRYLLFLLRTFHEFGLWRGVAASRRAGVAICIRHLFIAIARVALVVFVEFLTDFRLGISLEILIDALVVFVCASAVRNLAVTRGKIVILEGCRKNCAGLGCSVSVDPRRD